MSAATPTDTELERAIVSVPGVEAALVDRDSSTGRSRLRIRIAHGDDAPSIAWAIAQTLQERFGIVLDPSEIRPRMTASTIAETPLDGSPPAGGSEVPRTPSAVGETPPSAVAATPPPAVAETPPPAPSANGPVGSPTQPGPSAQRIDLPLPPPLRSAAHAGARPPRAMIEHLDTRVEVSDVAISATLSHGGRTQTGRVTSVPTQQGVQRAVAEATLQALRSLTGDQLVAGVDRVAVSVSGEPAMATVIVAVLGESGEETLLGSALVRDDAHRAVMRATLDAVNRRVERWLTADLPAASG